MNGTPPHQPDVQTPRFTVVVAIHNAEPFLADTLDSLQRQTLRNFEVIMVDDGSTDASAAIARHYVNTDSRFQLHSTPNRGISPTRNLAVQHARAPWIAVCDADDTWSDTKLERQAAFIDAWQACEPRPLLALGTAGWHVNARGQRLTAIDLGVHSPDEYERQLRERGVMPMINSSVVFRRDAFDALGGYRAEYSPAEDTDLWTRLARTGVTLNLPEPLTFYRLHARNVSTQKFITMMMHVERVAENTHRGWRLEPELDAPAFDALLHTQPARRARLLRELRRELCVNRARSLWYNGHRARGLAYRALAVLADPAVSLRRLAARARARMSGSVAQGPPEQARASPSGP